MEIKKLMKKQMSLVYENYMVNDFPDEERKPLSMILKSMDADVMDALGLYDGDTLLGYALFCHYDNEYLFDYYAIVDKNRNKGIGGAFLSHIVEYYKDANSIFGEVEDFEYAKNEEDASLQKRRMEFYLRNGFRDTGARVKLFGVDYIVLEYPIRKKHTRLEMSKLYKKVYRSMLPWHMFRLFVKIKK